MPLWSNAQALSFPLCNRLPHVPVFELDPLIDARWDYFVEQHSLAGVFHTSAWLRALQGSYQYSPKVFTTSAPAEPLTNGMLFCEVNSWLTGRRLVSLPFSDHCDPLLSSADEVRDLIEHLRTVMVGAHYSHVEFRPKLLERCFRVGCGSASSEFFLLHTLPLDPPLGDIFHNFHKSCIQRKIHRAEREGLRYTKGRTELLLTQFYQLQLRTRRRHNLQPQPYDWFRNLAVSLGDHLTVHVAYKAAQAVAAIITLSFKETVTYKYGCSDERFSHLGGTPFLFWKIIEESKTAGFRRIDLGRTEMDNLGLAKFKDRLGAQSQILKYYRLSNSPSVREFRTSWVTPLLRRMSSYMPDSVLAVSGRILYRHLG